MTHSRLKKSDIFGESANITHKGDLSGSIFRYFTCLNRNQMFMKIVMTGVLLIISTLVSIAQNDLTSAEAQGRHAFRMHSTQRNLDFRANLLAHTQSTGKEHHSMLSGQDHFIKVNGLEYVPALVKLDQRFNPTHFQRFNIEVNTKVGDIYSVMIPMEQFGKFSSQDGIAYMELAHRTFPRLEEARVAAHVDKVHTGVNLSGSYSGKDVVVGILDLGFDYTHPAFTDPEGNLRIIKSWEQNINRIPPPGYSYGNDIDQFNLLRDRYDASDIGHGAQVASLAGGWDHVFEGKYNGVAYECDLVFVSLIQLEGLSGLNTGVIDGISYVFDYAESVGKPAVVNLSQGHHTGPHDGTSLTDQAIDALSGPGRIIVGAVGNEGDPSGFYIHFDHDFVNENEIFSYLVWPDGVSAGETTVDIWGEMGEDFELSIAIFNPNSKILEAESVTLSTSAGGNMIDGSLIDAENDTISYTGMVEINPLNNRPHMSLYINSMAQSDNDDVNQSNLLDNDFIQLRFQGEKGQIHAYSANNIHDAFFSDLSGVGADEFIDETRVLGGNPNYTMGELGGTAHSIISVGAFTTKNTFTNTAMEILGTNDDLEDFYFRSSRGPTHDGRVKPDISAPGNLISGAENSFNTLFDEYIETDRINKSGEGFWSYTIGRGTSQASPLVAGIIALMLEIDPLLDPSQIKEMLHTLSDEDNFTGDLPNNLWGYGKVNAHSLIAAMENVTSTSNYPINHLMLSPNPTSGIVYLDASLDQSKNVQVFNIGGQLVFSKQMLSGQNRLDLTDLPNGLFFVNVDMEGVIYRNKISIIR